MRGAKIPPPVGFGVFFVFQNLATMAESSVLRMRAGICCSRAAVGLWWIGGGLSRIIKFMMRVSATGMLGLDLPR